MCTSCVFQCTLRLCLLMLFRVRKWYPFTRIQVNMCVRLRPIWCALVWNLCIQMRLLIVTLSLNVIFFWFGRCTSCLPLLGKSPDVPYFRSSFENRFRNRPTQTQNFGLSTRCWRQLSKQRSALRLFYLFKSICRDTFMCLRYFKLKYSGNTSWYSSIQCISRVLRYLD